MPKYAVGREEVLAVLTATLEPLQHVQAMWEAGAIAFDRIDEWSDIDLQVAVDDERVEEVFEAVESALTSLCAIDLKYRLPEPTWHGHSQVFYRLADASPFLMLDFVVMKAGAKDKFLKPEIHGRPRVYFDKNGVVSPESFDSGEFASGLRDRVAEMRVLFDLFRILTRKELNRGNDIEAVAFYHGYTLRPLLQALRIVHDPTRHNFHTRYVHYVLPDDAVARLRRLFFVADRDDLIAKRDEAERWFGEVMDEINDGPLSEDITRAAGLSDGEVLDA